jgi:acetylglutamate kinase
MAVHVSAARRHQAAAPWVVKIGGRLCETDAGRDGFARACARLDAPLVVVHGGGAAVSRLQQALGLEPRFEAGRRVTGAEDLEVVEMVLSGAVNGALVRALLAAGRRAVGLTGCDAGLVRCAPVEGLGRVGTPVTCDAGLVGLLLEAGCTPVVSPVSIDAAGAPLNVNADEVAAALAEALGAARLLLLSDVEGVRVGDVWQLDVRGDEVERLVAGGEVHGGMVPKLRAAARAIGRGVGEVVIGGFAGQALHAVRGTRVHAAAAGPAGGEPHAR